MDNNRINIMTSCDDNLTKYLFVQLKTMAIHLKDKEVHFYFLYNKISEENLLKLEEYSEFLSNISFHRVFVENIADYEKLSVNGAGTLTEGHELGIWPCEAYFTIECEKYLPKDVDRILYIDAGDVVFAGNIDEFYFCDFEDKHLLVTSSISKPDWSYFTSKDLNNKEYLYHIKDGLFNSGSYMINVEKFRTNPVSLDKAIEVSQILVETVEETTKYFGDQGLLSVLFIGKMKYFKYEEMKDLWYKPYNFTMLYFRKGEKGNGKKPLYYEPKIIHLANATVKPWKLTTLLFQEGIVKEGEIITVDEILEIASSFKQADLKVVKPIEIDETLIEPEMIPFFRYWFNLNSIVQKEIEEL